jgi:hypothetical protein
MTTDTTEQPAQQDIPQDPEQQIVEAIFGGAWKAAEEVLCRNTAS